RRPEVARQFLAAHHRGPGQDVAAVALEAGDDDFLLALVMQVASAVLAATAFVRRHARGSSAAFRFAALVDSLRTEWRRRDSDGRPGQQKMSSQGEASR